MTSAQAFDRLRHGLADILSWFRKQLQRPEIQSLPVTILNGIRSALRWGVASLRKSLAACRSYLESEQFRNQLQRARRLVMVLVRQLLVKIRGLILWLRGLIDSPAVKSGLTRITAQIHRLLPKPEQRMLVVAVIIGVLVILLVAEPEPDSVGTLPEPVPVLSDLPRFSEIPAGRERKAAFFGYFLPLIHNENRSILITRQKLLDWYQNRDELDADDFEDITAIAARYRVEDFATDDDESWQQLLQRVDIVPASLALAQAANESAWGTSRFARRAHNYFGQWCFTAGCGLVPKQRDANKTHEVAAFDSPQQSVRRYIRNLNRNSAYDQLRDIRAELRESGDAVTGYDLAAGLQRYSERGAAYIEELREMIEFNKLTHHDIF